MNNNFYMIMVFLSIVITDQVPIRSQYEESGAHQNRTWAVIGAGPAGILTVGLLLDLGVSGTNIFWIDPAFDVGRMGQFYTTVPGNAKTQMYFDFISGCKAFQACSSPAIDALYTYSAQVAYPLHVIVDPLIDITNYLKQKVIAVQDQLIFLDFHEGLWHSGLKSGTIISSYCAVLATGSHPKVLDYACNNNISLDVALNKSLLAEVVNSQDCIAVVGSSHSAVLVMKFLSELRVGRIINFYKKPLVYTIEMENWLLHSDGLKGVTAQWAREVLEKNPPLSIIRIFNTKEALDAWLPSCNKIIYACGFERNSILVNGSYEYTYDDRSGVIADRLFAIGIAFPEKYTNPLGDDEYRVGLKFFLEYAQRIMPEWIKKDRCWWYQQFNDLFLIDAL